MTLPTRQTPMVSILCALALAGGYDAHARTWRVQVDKMGDVPTVQSAVDSVSPGDTILVAAGLYTWNNQNTDSEYGMIHVPGTKQYFTIRSEAGPGQTILDAGRRGRVFFIAGNNFITVEGFTIQNGSAPSLGDYSGGGIAAHITDDVVRNCVFRDNIATYGGALWSGGRSAMRIENCEFYDNRATYGGAMFFINSSQRPTISGCLIRNNQADDSGGAIYQYRNGVEIDNTIIVQNHAWVHGSAIFARTFFWPSFVRNTTIAENITTGAVYVTETPEYTFERVIVAANPDGDGFAKTADAGLSVGCSDIHGNGGSDALPAGAVDLGGNFSLPPLFCGISGSMNFFLQSNSPCVEGNHPDGQSCGLIGARASGCGIVRIERESWGRLKTRFRR